MGGADSVTVNYPNFNNVTSLTVNAGTGADTLSVVGDGGSDSVSLTGDMIIATGENPISYSGLGLLDIDLLAGANELTVNLGGALAPTINTAATGGSSTLTVNGTAASDTVTITGPQVVHDGGATINLADVPELNVTTDANDLVVVNLGAVLPPVMNLDAGADDDTLRINGTVGADTIDIAPAVINVPGSVINHVNFEHLEANGGAGKDTFNVIPSATAEVIIDGGAPISGDPGVPPGDILTVDLTGVINPNAPLGVSAGTITSDNRQPVTFTSIEPLIVTDALEDNNSIAEATVLGSVPQITLNNLSIHNATDEDFFKITANATGSLVINALFVDAVGDLDIELQDAGGNQIALSNSFTDNEQIIVPVVGQEMYFLRVFGFGGSVNNYDLEIENFAVPVPISVDLVPADDTGMSNSDNVTNNAAAQLVLTADLSSFLDPNGDGAPDLNVLSPADVAANMPGVAVQVFDFGQLLGTATPLAGSNNTFFTFLMPVAAPQVEGLNLITAAATIIDGQNTPQSDRSSFTPPLFLTIDTIPPAPAGAPDLQASSDSGMSDTDNVTNVDRPVFTGITEPGAKVTLSTSFGAIGSGVADASGNWQITSAPLDDGIYDIDVLYEDVAGNTSTNVGNLQIEIDTEKPNTPFLDLLPADDTGIIDQDNITSVSMPDVTVVFEDPDGPDGPLAPATDRVKWRIFDRFDNLPEVLLAQQATLVDNGSDLVNVDLTLGLPAPFFEGQHGLKLEVEDRAGNLSDDFLLDVFIDVTPPGGGSPPALLPSSDTGMMDNDGITNINQPAFNGMGEPGVAVRVLATLGGVTNVVGESVVGADGKWEITVEPLDDGIYDIQAQYVDAAGNVFTTPPGQLEVTIDTTSPNLPFIDLLDISDTGMSTSDNITRGNLVAGVPNGQVTLDLSIGNGFPVPGTEANPMLSAANQVKVRLFDLFEGEELIFFQNLSFNDLVQGQTVTLSLGDAAGAGLLMNDGVHPLKLVTEDTAGNLSTEFLLEVTLDTVAPESPAPDLIASSDSGILDNDNVTNVDQPAFVPVALPSPIEPGSKVTILADTIEVGQGVVNTDGSYEITVEPLDDGRYDIDVLYEDVAGNISTNVGNLEIEIDTEKPNTPFLDLIEANDSGRSNEDNITNFTIPGVQVFAQDPDGPDGHIFPNSVIMYRVFDRVNNITPPPPPDADVLVAQLAFLSENGLYNTTVDLQRTLAVDEYNGVHDLKLEVEDRAGNLSDDFLLDILLDTIAPDKPTIQLDPASDTGVVDVASPGLFEDNITSDKTPTVIGLAEADAIVRVYGDTTGDFAITGGDVFLGETVAVPLNGNQNFPAGEYNLSSLLFDLNSPAAGFPLDGFRQLGATAEDVAGNVLDPMMPMPAGPNFVDMFLDTRGPQVAGVEVPGAPGFDLFALKPDNADQGPTPLLNSLKINFVDQPQRGNPPFVYAAVNETLATTTGNYQLIGDNTGPVAIDSINFADMTAAGTLGMSMVTLNFAQPLPDDRFTLTVSSNIADDVGNQLDGASQAASPFGPGAVVFPSGDGNGSSNFVARFTVDTRPEIGTYAFESVAVDINGNFVFDPAGQGDQTNKDLAFQFGFSTDARFAGNFADAAGADGFDKLAAYGFDGTTWRFLIDNDNDGVPNLNNPSLAIQGFPVAGNFSLAHPGDEVGLFTGTNWYLDTNGNLTIDGADTVLGTNMQGFPIVGDFDGDGLDDLGTWTTDTFQFDLANDGLDGLIDQTINFGFPGVLERPVAHDFDADGIDDIGLYVPQGPGVPPAGESDWFILQSADPMGANRIIGQVNTLNHPFSPAPLGTDIFASFGDPFAIPIVGNFDPPPTTATPDPLSNVDANLGAVIDTTLSGLNVANNWYAFTTSRDGTLRVDASYDRAGGDLQVVLYDVSGNLVEVGSSSAAGQSVSTTATAGETYLVAFQGTNTNVALSVINNDAPVAALSGPTSAVRGQPRQFDFSATDSSTEDQAAGFTYSIDWDGNGIVDETYSATSELQVEHVFSTLGSYDVTVTVADQNGTSSTVVQQVDVATFALQPDDGGGSGPTLMNLVYGGSSKLDAVFFLPAGVDKVNVFRAVEDQAYINQVDTIDGVTGRIIVYGGDGSDILASFGSTPVEFHGGLGDDVLNGGSGADTLDGGGGDDFIIGGTGGPDAGNLLIGGDGFDLLYGGVGADSLFGGIGNDVLIGGGGGDALDGGAGEDLLVSGRVVFDNLWSSLVDIRNEWHSNRDYATRVANLTGTGSGPHANGQTYLTPGTTVLDDGAVDSLIGSSDMDWFLYNFFTDLTDSDPSEQSDDLAP